MATGRPASSYTARAPLAVACAQQLTEELLVEYWDCSDDGGQLLLVEEVRSDLSQIMTRYVLVEQDWCPEEFLD